jgi:hypothetical protein
MAIFAVIALVLTIFSFNSLIFADDSITTEAGIAYADGDIIVDLPDVSAPASAVVASGQGYVQAGDQELPKAATSGGWALLNLILAIATGIIMLLLLVTFLMKLSDDDWDYEDSAKNHLGFLSITVVTTAASAILFLLTENMRMQMVLTDGYTLWHIAIAVATIIFAALSIDKIDGEDLNAI